MEGKQHVRFAQLLEQHISDVIKRTFACEPLTPATMKEIHVKIRQLIDTVFEKSTHWLAPEARSWLTDQFFKSIRINDEKMMGDQVILNEYKLSQLTYHDVEMLHNLFNETTLHAVLEEEYRTRSLA